MVAFLQEAVGALLFNTVTTAVQLAVFPATSVATRVTVFGPRLSQVKVFGLRERVKPQLSKVPLFTAEGLTTTKPPAPMLTVAFLQSAVGAVTSFNVTVKVQLLVFPLASCAVKVTRVAELWPINMVDDGGVCVTMMEAGGVQLSLTDMGDHEPKALEHEAFAGIS